MEHQPTSRNPLTDDVIVQQVLLILGEGSYIFAQLNKQWREAYKRTALQCSTAYSNAFSSIACLNLCVQAGFELNNEKANTAAGRHASIDVLEAAHKLGMKWSCCVLQVQRQMRLSWTGFTVKRAVLCTFQTSKSLH
jgi:hypothetical protein